jgi:hypothetical protein
MRFFVPLVPIVSGGLRMTEGKWLAMTREVALCVGVCSSGGYGGT